MDDIERTRTRLGERDVLDRLGAIYAPTSARRSRPFEVIRVTASRTIEFLAERCATILAAPVG
jgi:hypothetical protein